MGWCGFVLRFLFYEMINLITLPGFFLFVFLLKNQLLFGKWVPHGVGLVGNAAAHMFIKWRMMTVASLVLRARL